MAAAPAIPISAAAIDVRVITGQLEPLTRREILASGNSFAIASCGYCAWPGAIVYKYEVDLLKHP